MQLSVSIRKSYLKICIKHIFYVLKDSVNRFTYTFFVCFGMFRRLIECKADTQMTNCVSTSATFCRFFVLQQLSDGFASLLMRYSTQINLIELM